MRITQLDYSAIRAANSATANANSMALAVEQSQHNALATQFNVDSTKNYIDAVNRENYAKGWINASMRLANTGLQILDWGLKYKDQADGETAVNALTDAAGSLSDTYDQEYQNNVASFFDGDNNIVKPQAIIDQEDALRNNIQNLSISDSKKQEALADLEDMFNKAWDGVGEQLAGREIQARNDAWLDRRKETLDTDVALGSPDNGLAMIQNTSWLTPGERESESIRYTNDFNAKTHANQASMLARTKGQPSANEYIDNLVNSGEINEDEWLSLSALVNKVGGEQDANVAQNAVQYAAEQMEMGVLPVTINEQLKLELDNMDNERREYVQSQLNKAYYDHALTEFQWPDNISSLSGTQLRALQDDVNARGEALLPNMPVELNSLKATLQTEFSRRDEINADTNLDNLQLLYEAAGVTQSPSSVLKQMMATDDPESIATAVASTASNADDQKLIEMLGKFENREDLIHKKWKPLYKELVGNFESLITSTYGLDSKNPEEAQQISSIKTEAVGHFLDYFWYTDPEDISEEGIMDAYNKSVNIYFGENMQQLEKLLEKNQSRTLLQEGTAGYDATLLTKYSDIALSAPDGMIEQDLDNEGEYTSPVPAYQQVWMESNVLLREVVSSYTGKDVANWPVTPYKRTNPDGSTTEVPLPVIQSPDDNTRYAVIGNSLQIQSKEGGAWDAVLNLEAYQNPQGYQAPVSTDKPRNVLPDGEGGYIDERELSPEENNFLSYVASLENEQPAATQPHKQTVKETATPVAHQEKEPSIPLRRVKNSGTQFWYQGSWYLVNDLTEGSDVLNAYDRFIRTFKGSIPKVGY